MPAIIDPRNNWALVEQRLASETDPILIRNLEVVLKHMKAEATADFDMLMSTVGKQAKYAFFGSEDQEGFAGPKSREEVEAFYRSVMELGIHRIEHNIDRLIVDREHIVTEGEMKIAYPGQLLKDMGHPIEYVDAYYLYHTRSAIIWIIDEDGLVSGEDSYTGQDGFAGIENRRISLDDVITVEGK